MDIIKELFKMQDVKYRDFHKKLIPNVNEERIIGVRTPDLRKFSKTVFKSDEKSEFLNSLPHYYYEENNLHAFLIEQIKDFDEAIEKTEKFLPYIDNWATCDMFRPKIFAKNADKMLFFAEKWIKSEKTYVVRFGLGILHSYFLDERFFPEILQIAASKRSDEYYVKMMIAWFFATALAKQYKETVIYLEENILPEWIHNKTIQKACESLRLTHDTKKYLKTLKR